MTDHSSPWSTCPACHPKIAWQGDKEVPVAEEAHNEAMKPTWDTLCVCDHSYVNHPFEERCSQCLCATFRKAQEIPASGILPDGRDLFIEQMEAMKARRTHKPLGHRCAEPDCVLPIDHPDYSEGGDPADLIAAHREERLDHLSAIGDDAMTFTKHHGYMQQGVWHDSRCNAINAWPCTCTPPPGCEDCDAYTPEKGCICPREEDGTFDPPPDAGPDHGPSEVIAVRHADLMDDLANMVRSWRKQAEKLRGNHSISAHALEDCANALDSLLADYEED